jgi:hypothetical protein
MPTVRVAVSPRRPELTPLHRLVSEDLGTFFELYDERYLEQYGPLSEDRGDQPQVRGTG